MMVKGNIRETSLWELVREDAKLNQEKEASLAGFYNDSILRHRNLSESVSFILSDKLVHLHRSSFDLADIIRDCFDKCPTLLSSSIRDLEAIYDRDPACDSYLLPLLFFKGFHCLQIHRVSHYLWQKERFSLALILQSYGSLAFGVDIHPAAKIGVGIQFDHATGVVIGETCVIGDNVTVMQGVTLGGTGNETGDRHPKVADDVLLSTGAKVLGNIHIGVGAKIAAGSVVLRDVQAHTTVAGIPAVPVGKPRTVCPAKDMSHNILDDYSE